MSAIPFNLLAMMLVGAVELGLLFIGIMNLASGDVKKRWMGTIAIALFILTSVVLVRIWW